MARHLALPLALVVIGLQAAPVLSQDQFPVRASHNGAFERVFPEASRLLTASQAGRMQVLEQLAADPRGARLEGDVFNQLVQQVQRGRAGSASAPTLARLAPEANAVFERAHALQRQILDVYADDRVTDKYGTVEQVIDAYLRRPGVALPDQPKSVNVRYVATGMPTAADPHAGHGGGDAPAMDHPMGVEQLFPKVNGQLWAQYWLENALFEPLIRYGTTEERRAGADEAIARFRAMMEDAPSNYPTEMPTTAAIAPELTMAHPRASVILNGMHLLEDVVADLLTNPHVADKSAAIRETVAAFTDPVTLAITDYEWLLQSLRPGIFFQGGPAIGSMDRSERNLASPHARHLQQMGRSAVMPGMSGPRGGTMGPADGSGAQGGPDHSQHE